MNANPIVYSESTIQIYVIVLHEHSFTKAEKHPTIKVKVRKDSKLPEAAIPTIYFHQQGRHMISVREKPADKSQIWSKNPINNCY